MKIVVGIVAFVLVCGLAFAVGHLALIEVGREVVTLRTTRPDGSVWKTRLWIVDQDGISWLHSAGDHWKKRFADDRIVEVVRSGQIRRYRAHAVPGPHPQIDRLLREKYGIADRWVRFLAPCGDWVLPVRLEPIAEGR